MLDRALETVIMRDDDPVGIGRRIDERLRHRIARVPQLHRPIIDREGGAPDVRRRVGCIASRADAFQIEHRARLVVAMQQVRHGRAPFLARTQSRRLPRRLGAQMRSAQLSQLAQLRLRPPLRETSQR
jgi:hypothetical protein